MDVFDQSVTDLLRSTSTAKVVPLPGTTSFGMETEENDFKIKAGIGVRRLAKRRKLAEDQRMKPFNIPSGAGLL